jgi:hypothetical protein
MTGYWIWDESKEITAYARMRLNIAYIGVTSNPNKRFRDHLRDFPDSVIIVLETGIKPINAWDKERYWHTFFEDLDMIIESHTQYDVSDIGHKARNYGPLSDEQKQQISLTLKGRSSIFKDVPKTEEHKKKLSDTSKRNDSGKRFGEHSKRSRAMCIECNFESNPAGIVKHQKNSGHSGIRKWLNDPVC